MQVTEVDERDSHWEIDWPIYRVYFFTRPDRAVETYDIGNAAFDSVRQWAEENSGERDYSIAVALNDRVQGKGLVWIIGHDLNGLQPEPDPSAPGSGPVAIH